MGEKAGGNGRAHSGGLLQGMDVANQELVGTIPFGDPMAKGFTERGGVAWGEGEDPTGVAEGGRITTEQRGRQPGTPAGNDGAQGRIAKTRRTAHVSTCELA